jgi:hypothetical protein
MENKATSPQTGYRYRLIVVAGLILIVLALSVGVAAASGSPPDVRQAATPVGGQLVLPSATPTVIGGPTATPSRTPTITPVLAEVIGDPTNLRSLPTIGDEYIVASLTPGTTLPILGRWLGYDWLLVAWKDGPDGKAWVYEPLVIVHGDLLSVPAVEPPAPPTVNPTQAAIQATATILLQTPGAAETATATALFAPTGVYTVTPGGSGQVVAGVLPTFTPPPAYVQPQVLAAQTSGSDSPDSRGIPPAALIIALAAMGGLTLLLGLLRRVF